MNVYIIIFFYIISITGTFGKNGRIIGGRDADILEFPFQVSLRFIDTGKHHCGATIISNKHVVTAAHCVFEYLFDYNNLKVVVGSDNLEIIFKQFKILKINIHPQYTGRLNKRETIRNDISIIAINGEMPFNTFINKAQLPTEDLKIGEIVSISGFGRTDLNTTEISKKLQKTTMITINVKDCSNTLQRHIYKKQSCLVNREGIGACNGDSGGPVSINGVFVGILSFVIPCALGYPDVIIKVYPYLNYIHSIIDN